jgi:hypothetical protein
VTIRLHLCFIRGSGIDALHTNCFQFERRGFAADAEVLATDDTDNTDGHNVVISFLKE